MNRERVREKKWTRFSSSRHWIKRITTPHPHTHTHTFASAYTSNEQRASRIHPTLTLFFLLARLPALCVKFLHKFFFFRGVILFSSFFLCIFSVFFYSLFLALTPKWLRSAFWRRQYSTVLVCLASSYQRSNNGDDDGVGGGSNESYRHWPTYFIIYLHRKRTKFYLCQLHFTQPNGVRVMSTLTQRIKKKKYSRNWWNWLFLIFMMRFHDVVNIFALKTAKTEYSYRR